jgi:hypothetical protein
MKGGTVTTEEMVDRMRVAFAPEAAEFTKMMLDDPIKTTKDNYGRVMSFLSMMPEPEMKLAFIAAMADAGYPAATAAALTRVMGLA